MGMDDARVRDKFRGALLGTFAGDVVGAPVEGWDEERLNQALEAYGDLAPDDPERDQYRPLFGLLTGEPMPPGSARYTDDTEMMISVAESLAEHPEFDGAHLASRFVANFHEFRGYGMGAFGLIIELRNGEPWDEVGGRLFGGQGSFGNGAAMRAAPVGALYHAPGHVARLRRVADAQAAITHTHPLGRQGAVLLAAAVAAALRREPGADGELDREAFLDEVTEAVGGLEDWYREGLNDVRSLIRDWQPRWEAADVLQCGIEAHLSVPAAIYAFLARPDRFEAAVAYAVRLGGDTDTVGAMCGAIAGAYHGASAIPENWTAAMENGAAGRDYVAALADRLFDTWLALPPPSAGG
jgi:poly(ADP-ribose) glycohydrolase ARH3